MQSMTYMLYGYLYQPLRPTIGGVVYPAPDISMFFDMSH